MFRKLLDQGEAGDNIGALLRGTKREEVERGRFWRTRLDHAAHEVPGRGLHPDQGGGRSSHAVLLELSPAVLLPDDRRDGMVHLPEGTEMVMPGDNISMEVELIAPIAMDEGLRFAIREGGKTVARASSPRSSRKRQGDGADPRRR